MKYPQTKDWPSDETRIEAIMQNGNEGDHYPGIGLDDYLEDKGEIKALKKQVEQLEARLQREIKAKSKWKVRYESIKPERKSIRTKKNQQALDMITALDNGDKSKSLADIGRLLDIKYGTLKNMAYRHRKSQNKTC